MREKGFDQLPVLAPHGRRLVGLVTLGNLLSWISQGRATAQSPVEDVMFSFSKIQEVVTDLRDVGDIAKSLPSPTTAKNNSNTTSKHMTLTNGEADSVGLPSKQRKFVEITMDTPLEALRRFFEWNSAAVVTGREAGGGMRPVAVVTKVDLLGWLVKQGKGGV